MSLFQFYGYLSQQQNMMQDYVRTGTYQRAILQNHTDFKDKVSCQYRKPTELRLWVPERLRQGPPLPPSSSVAFFFFYCYSESTLHFLLVKIMFIF